MARGAEEFWRVAERAMRSAGLHPLEPYVNATAAWRSRCVRCERVVSTSYNKVQQGRNPCPYCAGTKLDVEDRIEVMRSAGLVPLVAYPGSHAHWKSRCERCAGTVSPTYHDVQSGKGGCAQCSPSAPVDPKMAVRVMKEAGLDPLVPFPGSNAAWRSRCQVCKKVVTPRYSNVRLRRKGCKFCAKNGVDPKDAVKLMRSKGLDPQVDYPGGNAPWPCICRGCGSEVIPSYTNISAGQVPCKYCAKTRVDPKRAVAKMRGWGLEPEEPFPGIHQPWTCTCLRCRRKVMVRYAIARKGTTRCPLCDKARRTLTPRVDETEAAEVMRRMGGVDPLVSYPGAAIKWRCRCMECGQVVTPTYANVRAGHRGCRHCAHQPIPAKQGGWGLKAAMSGVGRSRARLTG